MKEKQEKRAKMYTSAPLPFQGQKRHHVRIFRDIIKELQPKVVVDLFGGSGLLSHIAKHASPHSRVIYNDYDNYSQRLMHADETSRLLATIRPLLRDVPENTRIDGVLRQTILQKLKEAEQSGYVDWITVSSSLKFSMNYTLSYADFEKDALYNKMRMSNYVTEGYLDGLEVEHCDYRELCRQWRHENGTLFIFDPPYLSTDTKSYKSAAYWTLKDYLDVLKELNDLNYIYFTSDKSQIVELCQWLHLNSSQIRNIFAGASMAKVKSPTSGLNSYTDIMLYKLNAI
jgi:site-specific DNA-adenine methylase